MPKILKGNSLTQNPEHRTQNPAEEKNYSTTNEKHSSKTKQHAHLFTCKNKIATNVKLNTIILLQALLK